MKFESKFGIGEIVMLDTYKGGELLSSKLLKVKAILVDGVESIYCCENPETLQRQYYQEKDLEGDDQFDQEKGCYPDGQ